MGASPNLMRAGVQRVTSASVTVDGGMVGAIGPGLLVYLGVAGEDDDGTVDYLARKIAELRVFEDGDGRFSRSVIGSTSISERIVGR